MTTLIYWFRNDLRLHDNPAFSQAAAQADTLLPVYCLGSFLTVVNGLPTDILPKLARALGARAAIHCETIAATHEQSELDNLQETGVQVVSSWQSTLFEPDALPFKDAPVAQDRTRLCHRVPGQPAGQAVCQRMGPNEGTEWLLLELLWRDYDVYNNQGNWLYIAGMGTDPRGGRRFNVQKQAQDHDPDQSYQKLWQQV